MGLIQEFKDFAMRGNVVDMAVGIIIGGAFGTIVKSLVDDVMMPPLGAVLGNVDFSALALTIQQADPEHAKEAVMISYGKFINSVISFTIVAFALFMLIKAMNTLKRKEEAKPDAPPEPSNEEKLLAEIRDVLKAKA